MRFQDIFTQIYHEFKHDQGFSKDQCNKAASIRGVWNFHLKANIDYERTGFKDITSIIKYCSFEDFWQSSEIKVISITYYIL